MDWRTLLEARPIVVALAGSNGAGKSTFYHATDLARPYLLEAVYQEGKRIAP